MKQGACICMYSSNILLYYFSVSNYLLLISDVEIRIAQGQSLKYACCGEAQNGKNMASANGWLLLKVSLQFWKLGALRLFAIGDWPWLMNSEHANAWQP